MTSQIGLTHTSDMFSFDSLSIPPAELRGLTGLEIVEYIFHNLKVERDQMGRETGVGLNEVSVFWLALVAIVHDPKNWHNPFKVVDPGMNPAYIDAVCIFYRGCHVTKTWVTDDKGLEHMVLEAPLYY